MKIKKRTFILLLLNTIILPLLGNKDLLNLLHLNIVSNVINYSLPLLFIISYGYDFYKNKTKFKLKIPDILGLIFIICLIISLIFAVTIEGYTLTNLYKFIVMSIMIIIIPSINLKEYEKKFNLSLIITLIFICLYGIAQYIFKFQLTPNGIEKYPGAIGRIKSTLLIATILDKFIVLNIIYIFYLLFNNKLNKYLLYITLLLSVITLGLTYSRTGLVIYILSSIILLIYFIINKKWLLVTIIPVLVIIIYLLPGQKYVFSSIAKLTQNKISNQPVLKITKPIFDIFIIKEEEIKADTNNNPIDNQLTSSTDSSQNSREYFGDIAKDIMLKYPLTGIGIGNYNYVFYNQNANEILKTNKVITNYLYPHNMYYQLGSEIGIIGLLIFIISIIYNKKYNIFTILFIIGILISCLTESIFYIKDIGYFTVILLSIFKNKKENI